ncbi:NFXL1 [Mytilus edulis]|uniref:NFXL1 n=1 Tax=Mytilus edulis TaxID=6550 RepID=A0A8S3ULZ8_MYTED|nr:NFXL1 [Mytilus edulis]
MCLVSSPKSKTECHVYDLFNQYGSKNSNKLRQLLRPENPYDTQAHQEQPKRTDRWKCTTRFTGLKFNTQVTSQFACRSADNQTVATKPSENMSCGSTRRLYKYADKLSVDVAQKKFEAVSNKHQQAIQNVLEESQFSDDEEEGDIGDNVLSTVFKSYSDTIDHGEDEEKAREDMMYSFRSGTSACLVCIENIKREEAIWSCKVCYAMFHIPCIQKWVKEGVYQQVYKSDENIDAKSVPWHW